MKLKLLNFNTAVITKKDKKDWNRKIILSYLLVLGSKVILQKILPCANFLGSI